MIGIGMHRFRTCVYSSVFFVMGWLFGCYWRYIKHKRAYVLFKGLYLCLEHCKVWNKHRSLQFNESFSVCLCSCLKKIYYFCLSLHTWWNFNWFSYNVEYKNRNKTSLCWKEYTDLEIPLVFGIYKNNKVLNIISGVEF